MNETQLVYEQMRCRIQNLEKENAELKERVENQKSFFKRIKAKFNLGKLERKEIEVYLESDQLTKAKEIIKNILLTLKNEGSDYTFALKPIHHVLLEAEQFLKEE